MSHKIEINVEDEKITLDMPYQASFVFKYMGVILLSLSFLFPILFCGISLPNLNFKQPLNYVGEIGGFLIYIVFLLLWGLSYFTGMEHVEISRSGIYLDRRIFQIPLFQLWFDKKRIQGLFISKVFDEIATRTEYPLFKTGRIGFNIEKTFWGRINTIRFGSTLDQNRAREILALIFEHFPEYRPSQIKSKHIQ